MRSGIQAFIAGFIGPSLFVLVLYALLATQGSYHTIGTYPLYIIPLLWAIWNVLYYYIGRHVFFFKKLGVWGAILGLALSWAGVHYYHTVDLYQRYLAINVELYQALILDGVLYFFLWESVIRYVNRILID